MNNYKDYGYKNYETLQEQQYIFQPLLQMISPERNKSILDLGCGNGAFVNFLISKGFNCYGIDASESGIKLAEKLNPGKFAVHDLNNRELPEIINNNTFDTIIATELIEHLYDPKQFIGICKTILNKNNGGTLILSTPYHGYFKNLLLSVLNKWDLHANPLWDGGHIKFWSKHTITKLLEENQLKVVSFKGCGRLPYLWKSMLIEARFKE